MKIDTQNEIKRVKSELDEARNRVAVLEPRLDWLVRGEELYGDDSDGGTNAPQPSAKKPTLGDAIITVLREGSDGGWTALQVMDQLRARGWMPNGTSAEHVVRAKLASLARGDTPALRRIGHGVYEIDRDDVESS